MLGDTAAEALGRALVAGGPAGTLRALKLAVNQIGSAGARYLIEGLRAHPSLTELDLSENPVGVEGAAAAAAVIEGRRPGSEWRRLTGRAAAPAAAHHTAA